jgi:bis(5'-nucleosyl)-tetraphosphatase (symmetrical)
LEKWLKNLQNIMKKRTIFIGDIHGCYLEFKQLLAKCAVTPEDRVIVLGDMINKGPDSRGVVEYIREHRFEALMGNHEYGFIKYLKGHLRDENRFSTFSSVKEQLGIHWKEWLTYFEELPLFIEDRDFMAVHGGLVPDLHPRDVPAKILTRIRTWDGKGENLHNPKDPAWYELYRGQKLVVFGHWAQRGLVVENRVVGLDTGCVYGGKLSAFVLPEGKIVQIDAKKAYISIK